MGVPGLLRDKLMEREYFTFYRSFYEAIRDLPNDIKLEVYTAIVEYGLYGEAPEEMKPFTKAVFTLVKPNIDASLTRYQNGRKGGRPKTRNQIPTVPRIESEAPGPEAPQPPAAGTNAEWLTEFFAESHKENLLLLCKNFGLGYGEIDRLRSLADAVIGEWELSRTPHHDYSDWSRHLISAMRIKSRDASKPNNQPRQSAPPKSDYSFKGGFGGQDV